MKTIKILFILIIFTLLHNYSFAEESIDDPPATTIEGAIHNLFYIYKTQNYPEGVLNTTGRMNKFFTEMVAVQKKFNGTLPTNLTAFSSTLRRYIILGQAEKGNLAEVSLYWIFRVQNGHSSEKTHLKINYVNYLLEKVGNQWKIKDAHFKNEYILYDKDDIESIRKKIEGN